MTANARKAEIRPCRLREDALEKLTPTSDKSRALRRMDYEELVHELRVHQIELQMQNEQLRDVQLVLEESRDKYADLYDYAPTGYFTLNHDAIILEANLTGVTLLGGTRSQLINHRFRKFIVPEDIGVWDLFAGSLLRECTSQTCDMRLRRLDGSVFHVQADGVRVEVPAAANRPKETVMRITITDTTAHRLVEDELNRRTEELEVFFNVALDLLCILDAGGKFIRVNKAWEDLLGYSRTELEGRKLQEFVHADDIPATSAALSAPTAQKPVIRFTHRFRCRDGSYLYLDWRSHRKGKYIYSAAHDITEQKNLEALRASLLRDLSHQLKTPLSIIEMAVGLIAKDPALKSTDSLDMISRNTKELRQMVSSILQISSLENDAVKINKKRFNLTTAVGDIVARLLPIAKNKALKLSLSAPKKTLINSDEEIVTSVIKNLVENAIKFTEKGSINVSITVKDGEAEVSVRDTGIGLTKSQLSQLSMKFYKVDASTNGTGLGLAICKENVRLLGGRITMDSNGLGKGTVVSITLPMK